MNDYKGLGIVNRLSFNRKGNSSSLGRVMNSYQRYGTIYSSTYAKRMEQYFLMQSAFDGEIFLDNQLWKDYLDERDLHPKTMCIINPVQRLADFYAGRIYPGYLSSTGFPVVANVPLAIPLVTDDKELRYAIGQIWQWGNWEENLIDWIRMGATLGDAPVEIVDDFKGGKVYPEVIRPEWIIDIKENNRKNIEYYTKELFIDDPENPGEQILYTRTITKDYIRTYREHYDYGYDGMPAEYPNPYGFVPLVWVKHRNPGNNIFPGKPAVRDWRKIEELNSDYTRLRMYIRKQALTPMLLAAMGTITPPMLDVDNEQMDIEDFAILTASEDGNVYPLNGSLELSGAFDLVRTQLAEIDDDHPELRAEQEIKKMSQVTGPASQALLTSVTNNIKAAAKGYDGATISMLQQLVAIGGMRANEKSKNGGWADLTNQQKKFLPFDLNSYSQDKLEFTIAERDALPTSKFELAKTKEQEYLTYAAGERAGIPLSIQFINEDMPEEKRREIFEAQEEDHKRKLERQREELELELEYAEKLAAVKAKYSSSVSMENVNSGIEKTDNENEEVDAEVDKKTNDANEKRRMEGKIVNGTGK